PGRITPRAGLHLGPFPPPLPTRRENDHRRRTPFAQLAGHLGPGPIRQHEIEDQRVRRTQPGRRQRSLDVLSRVNLVAGRSQTGPQRAQDLRFVVDHQHPLPVHAPTSTGTSGSASTKVAPCPSCDSTQIRPPLASANPCAIARPKPAPRPSATEPRWNGEKIRSRSTVATPGPRSITRNNTSAEVEATRTCTRSADDEYLSAFSSKFASARCTCCPSTRTASGCSGSTTSTRPASTPKLSSASTTRSSTNTNSARGSAAPPPGASHTPARLQP